MTIVEALQKNKEPFGLMSTDEFTNEEMQAKAKEIQKCGFFEHWGGEEWIFTLDPCLSGCTTYRLRPDYAEKPSVVECEVESVEGILWYFNDSGIQINPITSVINKSNFIGFRTGLWLTGLLYEHKEFETIKMIIKFAELDQYNVLRPDTAVFEVKP